MSERQAREGASTSGGKRLERRAQHNRREMNGRWKEAKGRNKSRTPAR